MAQVYRCDACKEIIENRYKEKMKSFFVGYSAADGYGSLWGMKKKVRVDLCDRCYRGLRATAEEKAREKHG